MSQPKYKIYPSLLDAFQRVKDAREEFESFYNVDADGNYKRTYDEIVDELEQQLLDSINKVPHLPAEKADRGTAFNEIVDCLVHNRPSTNDKLTIKSELHSCGSMAVRAEINGFTFHFGLDFCKDAANYFKGATSQYFVSAVLPTRSGDVELYGFLDELREDVVYDIKTTDNYSFGKFADHWQKHVYPYCLVESGLVTEIREFEYTVYQMSGGNSRTPLISGQQFRERYDFDYDVSKAKLTGICTEFIEWLEAHRDKIFNRKIFCEAQPEPYYLFFDTETTGLPKDFNAPYTDILNWPRLVQLGWIITDKDGTICKVGDRIIRPDRFDIPEAASAVHGITTEYAAEKGFGICTVLKEFGDDLKVCKHIVGHNIKFDKNIVACELKRYGVPEAIEELLKKPASDTMLESADYVQLPKGASGHGGKYKYPRLTQLYEFLFGHAFDDAHNALADITATMESFFELKRLGVIQDE